MTEVTKKLESFIFQNEKINRENFTLNMNFSFDSFYKGYPTDWCYADNANQNLEIFYRVPFALHSQYITEFKQFFEPSNFYRNITTICALAEVDKSNLKNYEIMINQYIEHALNYSITDGKSRYTTYNFKLKRKSYFLESQWVSAIGNAFIIRALTRVYLLKKDRHILSLIREYSRPFMKINSASKSAQGKWFTWLDKEGFLWFDEYPGDDGQPSLVLNGHIHSMHALYSLLQILPESIERQAYMDLYQAALTTAKYNTLKFRRIGKVNSYSLRELEKDDYLPDRTVRQQLELYKVTRDMVFKKNAELFLLDFSFLS